MTPDVGAIQYAIVRPVPVAARCRAGAARRPLSQLLDGLGVSTVMHLDVVKDAQLVLNLPTPLKAFDEPGKQR